MAKVWKVLVTALMIGSLLAVAPPASAGGSTTVKVTNGDDAGDGSFRAAVEAANADSKIKRIVFDHGLTVDLDDTVEFTGAQQLTIVGNHSTVSGANIADDATWDSGLFASKGETRSLTVKGLTFADSPNNGLGVFVPENHGGTVRVTLKSVKVFDAQFHGVHIDGQATTGFNTDDVLQPGCTDPHPFDSNSRIVVDLKSVNIVGAGDLNPAFDLSIETGCPQDFDGLRVDQGGPGNLIADIVDSSFNGNLADGAELDETGDGKVDARVTRSSFIGNGDTVPVPYTDEDGEAAIAIDLDDGFDIDEAGAGNLIAKVTKSTVSGNFDEGLDFDEAGAGKADVTVVDTLADGNTDEGVKVDEEDGGNLIALLRRVTVINTADNDAVQLAEIGDGSVKATIVQSTISDNDGDGVKVEESGLGNLNVTTRNSVVTNNNDGFQLVESEEGDEPTDGKLTALIKNSAVTGNNGAGVKAEQTAPGTGTVTLKNVDLSGNGDGETDFEGVELG